MTNADHGTTVRYSRGCRCLPCRSANAEYQRQGRLNRFYGRSNLVDAEPARQHLARLKAAGMTNEQIVAAAGFSAGSLRGLRYGTMRLDGSWAAPSKRITRDTEAKVLAIKIPTMDRNVGVMRRLQALQAIGWTLREISDRTGISHRHLGALARGEKGTCVATWESVRDAYEAMWRGPESPSVRVVRESRAKGWAPPMAWDDIDDPQATAAGVQAVAA